ncbi:unnamed protein product [Clonostachys rhizophaga]|uniref:Uncharacterized protein n=1 Tax=Clonostachys rhizophaga TaxID=160324 RepID=A0A9N9VH11_9HYPO|nr:unnamed protein product [Clonostachys rhizophaga]
MASPILSQRTYRLTQIPHGTTVEEVEKSFPLDVRDTIERLSLARCADPTAAGEQVSTVTFKTEPSFLASLSYKFGSLLSALVENIHPKLSRVWIDAHFHGFTPLNNPTDETATVHIIALTGLGGKAFASWQCYDGSMWLRDHAPVDIPNCLISIYGYSSDVGNTDSISTLSEMAESFVLDLTNYAASGALGDKVVNQFALTEAGAYNIDARWL